MTCEERRLSHLRAFLEDMKRELRVMAWRRDMHGTAIGPGVVDVLEDRIDRALLDDDGHAAA